MTERNQNTEDTTEFLSRIRIASPCSARWEDVIGDDRSRFCQQCSKMVYHLPGMGRSELLALLREKDGQVCARLYMRRDGTVLNSDCPMGLAVRARRRLKAVAFAAALAVCGAIGAKALVSTLKVRLSRSTAEMIGDLSHEAVTGKVVSSLPDQERLSSPKMGCFCDPELESE